ncbi:beta-galactosidase [Granulicella paludicola]|uniref:beta-galactosidase n=1 Tax=Granulicella paludicola TaxID=474951 RepID=UPI0021E071F6|nr:beta-galactosidase [Granulicella paludicola]
MNRRSFCLSSAAFAAALAQRRLWSQSPSLNTAGNRILLGVDYYPDQTPESLWAEDATMMAEAGINNVRLAEFAWALMEPSETHFSFEWLQRSVRLLHAHGIDCILGTPSAAPPQWLSFKYPEVLLVNDQGLTMSPDSRRYTCPTNTTYRRFSNAITTQMAKTFANEPGVIGWQIDNEFTLASYPRCYCHSCRAGFQQWVKAKYGTLDAVNAAWGTSFWSQTYTDFAQIPTPLPSPAPPNPGFALDYDRFQSDSYASFQSEQLAILRSNCPKHFITTNNVAGLADSLNLRHLYRDLDFASADSYPAFSAMIMGVPDDAAAPFTSFCLDAMRWAKKGAPFLIMEEQSGKSGQPTFSAQPQKGQVRLWTYQAIAHGAMGINYFRWDTARFGAEEYWHGLLNHDRSKSPAFGEITQTIRELKHLDPQLLTAPVAAEVAIAFDPTCDWATTLQPGQPNLKYLSEVSSWYAALWSAHHSLDCIDLTDDLSRYKLIVMPLHYVLSKAQAEGAKRYVEQGGTLVIGCRSGVKTDTNQVVDMPRPGLLAEIAGITVADYAPMYASKQAIHSDTLLPTKSAACELWYETLTPTKAEVLATYTMGDAATQPAITRNRFGKGAAYYIGSRLGAADNAQLLSAIATNAGIKPAAQAPTGIELSTRAAGNKRWLIALNHTPQPATLNLQGSYRDLLTNASATDSFTLPRYGVAILQAAQT